MACQFHCLPGMPAPAASKKEIRRQMKRISKYSQQRKGENTKDRFGIIMLAAPTAFTYSSHRCAVAGFRSAAKTET
jgi:hypothetical protein